MILRSAFWLAVGFALVAPHGTNFGQAAAQLRDQAIASGTQAATQIIVSQVLEGPAARTVATGLLPQAAPAPAVPVPAVRPPDAAPSYVFPRPRPAALG
jgi:hypothetical protein